MPKTAYFILALAAAAPAMAQDAPAACKGVVVDANANQLSAAEKAEGWTLLWDGKTSAGWRSARGETFPQGGWTTCGGTLTIHAKSGEESRGPGDIITNARYSDFELSADFKITPGANSGIKIFTQTDLAPIDKVTGKPVAIGSGIGIEFQVLDDERHPDAKLGRDGDRTIGSFYDVIPAVKDKEVFPVGQWNNARIISKNNHVAFFLNGFKTVEFTRGSPEFRAAVALSKFKDIPGFGEWADGHILLQDHGNTVSYRNIKIRTLATH
ncbi:3-keto-disaccharide hydrolase [Rhizomicrobium electricum]|uniref:3-keto-alpha-glucoside-1,2-lyase/3-keto-2-hydroxy-glucal hydratase domain-containing protein n=1 Tax=Rhizomicrobium electricum TaxID=480070 RepID=A0ABN1ESW4_9PROT|nr:DUF1080 domain-containing protein [Rhizomicrobium electricum]NIJ49114.1 hypothetical protein [Rhizomicrobium electricum]